jgi:glycosyltransferase involved in cell wall biosynthesis
MSDRPIKVLHVVTGMGEGGAESMLARLIAHSDAQQVRHHLLALSIEGPLWRSTARLCSGALNLRLDRKLLGFFRLSRIPDFVRASCPDVIHGWMYHGNVAGEWLRRRFARQAALIFGIRQSLYDLTQERTLTQWVIKRGARLSAEADSVIYNSEISRSQHHGLGYSSGSDLVIANGFEIDRFRPVDSVRNETRRKLNIADDEYAIGIVGRFHPVKDHATFLAAARLVLDRIPNARFFIAGPNCTSANIKLRGLLDSTHTASRVTLLGSWADPSTLYPAFDAFCLTSVSEGFPNVVGEAMSCGTPCVVTDVGDVSRLVGDNAILVPPRDETKIAEGLIKLLDLPAEDRRALGLRARHRIVDLFGIDKAVRNHMEVYSAVAQQYRSKAG